MWLQMDDASIAEVLERRLKVKAGSLLFVQTTVPVKKLPKVCSKFRCFTRDSVWKERSDEVRLPPHITPQVHVSTLSFCKTFCCKLKTCSAVIASLAAERASGCVVPVHRLSEGNSAYTCYEAREM